MTNVKLNLVLQLYLNLYKLILLNKTIVISLLCFLFYFILSKPTAVLQGNLGVVKGQSCNPLRLNLLLDFPEFQPVTTCFVCRKAYKIITYTVYVAFYTIIIYI